MRRGGSSKAKEITKKEVIQLLEGIFARGAPVQANRAFALIRKVFNFGVENDILEFTPCYGLQRREKKSERDRVLSLDEIRAIWRDLVKQRPLAASRCF